MSLPSSMADFVPCDRLLQKAYCVTIAVSRQCISVYMTPGRLSPRSEFTPVPSHGSIFVYMIPPQNVIPARVTPA